VFIYRKMVFTEEDKVAIKFLRDTKLYGAKRLLAEFPAKQWSLGGLNKLLKKIDETGSIERSKGAGQLCCTMFLKTPQTQIILQDSTYCRLRDSSFTGSFSLR